MFQFFTPILDEVLEDIEGGRFSVQVNGNKTTQTNKFWMVNIKSTPKYSGKCTQNSRSVSGRVCVYSALLLPGFQYINHNHCLTAIQDSSSIHHRLWFISLQLFAIISNYLKVCAIICNYLQLSKGVWDDRRSCAWLGSPSLWLGESKHSFLNLLLSLVEISYQYMYKI